MKIAYNAHRDVTQVPRQWGETPALAFHRGIPDYAATPLRSLPGQAARLGISALWVKDESPRFGLNAFKGLGGSWTIGQYLCAKWGIPIDEKAFSRLMERKETQPPLTFITTTDGNHGRGVAWAAKRMGQRAVIHMPAGTVPERLENIRAQGAQADILPMGYDDAVRYSAREAEEKGYILVQDTAWPGYEELPTRVMEGYTTMAWEMAEALPEKPTHLFVQAGVGSMAGAVAAYFAARLGEDCPKIIVLEPESADCHYRTALADDGALHAVTGEMTSVMAGLCCGEVNPLSWALLKASASAFIACSDAYTEAGMRLLGRPLPGDPKVVSGESGAVGAGVLEALMTDPALAEIRQRLEFGPDSRVVLISTEGDTDQEHYRQVLGE